MTPLARSILKTLAFFDAQDLSLTLMEIRNYLIRPINGRATQPARGSGGQVCSALIYQPRLYEIQNLLETELSDKVKSKMGFYFLRGRDDLVNLRDQNYHISLRRMDKARKILYFLCFIPYIRAVAISGSQALLNSTTNSDIDLLIITAKNRIWLSRMLVSFYFQILGQRRYKTFTKSRFCLNHYLDEDLLIKQDQNLYTAVEYASLLPVLGEEVWGKFDQKNQWFDNYLVQVLSETGNTFFGFRFSIRQKLFEILLEITLLAPVLNWLASIYQKSRIRPQDYVLVSDCELSFHPESKGQQVLARYHLTVVNFGL